MLIFDLPQHSSCSSRHRINTKQGEAVAGGAAFGSAEVVTAIEAGHTGEV